MRDLVDPTSTDFAGWLVSLYGLLIAAAALLYVRPAGASSGATFAAAFGLVLLLIPAFGLAYGGYWLTRGPFEWPHQQRILNWCGWGSLGIASLVGGIFLYLYWIGYSWGDPGFIVLMGLASGGSIGFVFGVKNETVRIQAERLESNRRSLLFLNRLLRHNVLNGVNIVSGYAGLLRSDLGPEYEELLEPITVQSDRIVRLIQNVRVFSESLLEDLPTEPVDLSRTLADVTAAVSESSPAAEFRTDIETGVVVAANEVIESAFENLLWNAIEHNDTDLPTVSLSLEETGREALVRISDDGPGIPPEERDDLFEPGEHGDSGMGLFIVASLVDRYDGRIDVSDNEPRGTTVSVRLPLADRESDGQSDRSADGAGAGGSGGCGGVQRTSNS